MLKIIFFGVNVWSRFRNKKNTSSQYANVFLFIMVGKDYIYI